MSHRVVWGGGHPHAEDFRKAASNERPISAAADAVADGHGVALLGHDDDHVERCRLWLLAEKDAEPAFASILAYDLGSLLALSRAKLLACAGAGNGRAPVPVLIRGETGTGKELLTKAIHQMSRPKGALIPIHVGGMPKDQISDEIFGHGKGAFTGADKPRDGRLLLADKGTVQLDEVGDLPQDAQVRLLRVLQDGVVSRLGENATRTVDVRVVACTWHDLEEHIAVGTFRRDLFHRICAGEVVLPPLRDRAREFGRVVQGVLARIGESTALARSASDALAVYPWPGNLRELDNVLRVAASSADGGAIRLEDLPPVVQSHYLRQPIEVRGPGVLCDDPDGLDLPTELIGSRVALVERMIDEDTPEQELAPAVKAFLDAMDGLPDGSGTHESVLQQVRANIELAGVGAREAVIGERLSAVARSADLPPGVQAAVEAAAARHTTVGTSNLETAQRVGERLDLRQSPWGRLYLDLSELPVLRGMNHGEVLGFVSILVKLAQTLDPGSVDYVRQVLKSGGLRALIDGARHAVIDANDPGDDDDEGDGDDGDAVRPEGHPKSWTAAQWEDLVRTCETRKNLEQVVGLDGKTIKRHLERVGVTAPWART